MVKFRSNPSLTLVTLFSLGKIRYASGTFGSLAGLLFALPFMLLPYNYLIYTNIFFIMIIALSIIPIHLSLSSFDNKDPKEIIIDEFAGILCALLFINPTLKRIVILFFLFRLFDIIKPWPISWAEKAPGAIGVILDDLIAGIISNLLLRAMEDIL